MYIVCYMKIGQKDVMRKMYEKRKIIFLNWH